MEEAYSRERRGMKEMKRERERED